MKKGKILGLVTGLAILALAACAPAPSPTSVPPTAAAAKASASSATSSSAAITVTDDAKRSVTISSVPQRIVSLAPSTTEIAFALGLGKRIVAVDKFSDYPAETKDLNKINTTPLNLEQVVALKPDLVLAASITSSEDVKKLGDLGLPVLVVGSTTMSIDNVTTDIALVAKATSTDDKGKQVIAGMKQKEDAVKAKLANAKTKPKVYWELDATDPTKPYTPGPGSFINDIIALSSATNVAANAKSPYAQINAEEVVAANPDVIILSDFAYGTTVESVKARNGWSVINAVKNDRVLPIDDNLVSRPGPRIVDGFEAASKLIHPELFQ